MSIAPAESSLAAGQFCGTTEVARILGLSVGTVQSLVERQELQAWKTRGGHRRISLASVQDYQRRNHSAALGTVANDRIMWVQEGAAMRQKLSQTLSKWGIRLQIDWFENMVEASMSLQTLRPGLVVIDLKSPQADAMQFIRHVHAQTEFSDMTLLVMSGTRLPDDVLTSAAGAQVLWARKPLDWSWLRGYCEAYQMLQLRQTMH